MQMRDWKDLWHFALALDLPGVVETTAWGNPCLKAHGKMWAWWAPQAYANAPAFKVAPEEMEMLLDAAPEIFFTTDHHKPYAIILMRPDHFDAAWARDRLIRNWRAAAPKRFLKAWDEEHPHDHSP